jgi:hypothetical protein
VLSPMRREIASVISVRKVSVSIPVPPFLTISAVFTIAHSHISTYLHQINSRGSDRVFCQAANRIAPNPLRYTITKFCA